MELEVVYKRLEAGEVEEVVTWLVTLLGDIIGLELEEYPFRESISSNLNYSSISHMQRQYLSGSVDQRPTA